MRDLLDRVALRRRGWLVADRLLSELENAYVSLRGGAERRRDRADIDLAGRSSVESIHRTNVAEYVWPKFEEAARRGADIDDLVAAFEEATVESGEELAHTLRRRAPQMLRDHRRVNRGMHRRIRAIWGPALDSFYEIYVSVEEFGDARLRAAPMDAATTAVGALHGRACLLLLEIHTLLTAGLPNGAWGRTRSLHETAVIASLISIFGRDPSYADLPHRFLDHGAVDELRDLKTARNSGATVDDSKVADLEKRVRALVAAYGPGYDTDYGWARPLAPGTPPDRAVPFVRLEGLAETQLGRYEYRRGNHHVHASARTVDLHVLRRGDQSYRITGPTNVGFAEPAAVALLGGLTSSRALVFAGPGRVEPIDLVILEALAIRADETIDLLHGAQDVVDAREERVQRRLGDRRLA